MSPAMFTLFVNLMGAIDLEQVPRFKPDYGTPKPLTPIAKAIIISIKMFSKEEKEAFRKHLKANFLHNGTIAEWVAKEFIYIPEPDKKILNGLDDDSY